MQFKGFKFGKPKEKNEKTEAKNKTSAATAVLEEPLSGSTKNPKQLKKLSGSSGENADIPARPHRPIGELKIGEDVDSTDDDSLIDENDGILAEEKGEEVKLVEVSADVVTSLKAKAAASPKAEAAIPPKTQAATSPKGEAASPIKEDKTKPEDAADSLNKLFSSDDEEENPLANLIRSMPDVTTDELIEDLNEIKGIIREWQQK